ncbi:tigger transposable element-derived protein 6-like [Aphis gossypii]|uniref:tigger transposable element-derived protein 6-like n=1 Tax=Aphis gossypii TaxID=80765 RepID=UPI002158EE5E|nr:tigger transposable element-derived protein 6-like [Aphis gossypii]
MLPNRTLKFKGEKCSGGKMSKERLTVLVSASMTGKKMKLIIIGKSRNPRCFKNINSDCLPVTYESNSKAWMTAELWSKILLNWDLEFGRKKEKILLLVDNCPAHCAVALRNIKLVFLPSNCTSVLQPMDQGVIKCMKTYFRKSLVLNMINNIENKIEANISVLDGILMIFKAWEKVSEITIRNCFRHAGFNNAIPQQIVQGEQEEDISFPNINEYVNFDNDVLTSEPLSDQEIISSLINQPEEPEEDDNSEEADTPDGDLSINAVFNAAKMLANYMALNNVSPKINFEELEKKIERDFYTNKVQSKITDFFK